MAMAPIVRGVDPAPVLALHEGQRDGADAEGEERRADEVGERAGVGLPRLDERPAARRPAATTHTGRLTKNTQRQPAASTRSPPSVGPKAAATAPIEPQMATAIGTRSRGVARSTRASDVGVMAAAPTACRTRAAISSPARRRQPAHRRGDREHDEAADEHGLRPQRSASRPAGTSRAANTSV